MLSLFEFLQIQWLQILIDSGSLSENLVRFKKKFSNLNSLQILNYGLSKKK